METQSRTIGPGSGPPAAAIMTAHAPDRRTVEAVFMRRPERDEATEILGDGTRGFFARAGHPGEIRDASWTGIV